MLNFQEVLRTRPLVPSDSGLRQSLKEEHIMGNRILVVDDEKEVRTILFRALTQMGGFHVDVAESAEQALHKIEEGDFELVLTDLRLPGMDGLQLVSEIVRSRPAIITIVLTGHATIARLWNLKTGSERLSPEARGSGGDGHSAPEGS